ncbi:hypothetical protein ACWDA7_35285, partial [Streptomyces sp. NPDC001156]
MYLFVVVQRARRIAGTEFRPVAFFLLLITCWGGGTSMRGESLRTIAAPFVAVGPSGVAIRTRLKALT